MMSCCLPIRSQAKVAALQQVADSMFPEGTGKPKAKAKLKGVVPMVNALFVNAKEAVGKFFKARGYDSKRPQYTKEKLGFALDQYEAIAFVTVRVMGYALFAVGRGRLPPRHLQLVRAAAGIQVGAHA
jgi:hypothetical protein